MNPRVALAVVLCSGVGCSGQVLLPEAWYVRNSRTTNALNGITCGGVFVTAGDAAAVSASGDGINWTLSSAPGTSVNLFFAAYAPVGYAYLVGGNGGAFASRDGTIWSNVLSTASGTELLGAAYYYTHGYAVVAWDTNAHTSYIYSSWNLFSLSPVAAPTTNALRAIATAVSPTGQPFPAALYVAVGDAGTIVTSNDGTNWVLRDSGTTVALRAVTYHQGRMLAGGDHGVVLVSTDGVSWSAGAPASFNIRGLASSGDVVVAVGGDSGSGRLQVSADGLSWPGTALQFSNRLNAVAYGLESFVAVGDGGLVVQSSYAPNSQENVWTKQTSGYWEEPYWSSGHLPSLSDPMVVFDNPGWKALAIGPNTTANFSNSLTLNSLTIAAPAGSSNVLLLNYAGTNVPLAVNSLTLQTNASLISYGSAVSAGGFSLSSPALFAEGSRLGVTNEIWVGSDLTLSNSIVSAWYLFVGPNGTVTQYAGASEISAIVMDGDSTFNLSAGSLSVHELQLAAYPGFPPGGVLSGDATFVQTSGDVTTDIITLGDSGVGRGNYVFQAGTFYSPQYQFNSGTFTQAGGTNTIGSLTLPQTPPLCCFTAGTYALSEGTLLSGNLTLGAPGMVEQFTHDGLGFINQSGGLHINSGGITIPGFMLPIYMSEDQLPHSAGLYSLSGGILLCPVLDASYGGYSQSGGTNCTGLLSVGGYSTLTGGEVITSNTTIVGYQANGYEPCTPSVVFTQTNGTHFVQNKLLVQHLAIYDFAGGALNAQDVELAQNAVLNCANGIISNWGNFILSGAVFHAGTQSHFLGKLQAGSSTNAYYWCPVTNSTLEVSGAAGTFLRFRDSRDASVLAVQIVNWQPWTAGGGSHHIFFGTNAQALTTEQLNQLVFVEPLGWPPGLYPGRLLSTGELVPAPPPVVATRSGGQLILSWPGDFQLATATNVLGPYTTVLGAVSPLTNEFIGPERYFRLTLPGP